MSWDLQLAEGDTVAVGFRNNNVNKIKPAHGHFAGRLVAPYPIAGAMLVYFMAVSKMTYVDLTGTDPIYKYETPQYNYGGRYDPSTGSFTAPMDGIYTFSFSTYLISATNSNLQVCVAIDGECMHFVKNEGDDSFIATLQAGHQIHMSWDLRLTTGQVLTVKLRVPNDNTRVNTYMMHGHFAGRLVTETTVAFLAHSLSGWTDLDQGELFVLDKTQYNNGGHYDTATGLFTAPQDGVYTFSHATYHSTLTKVQGTTETAETVGEKSVYLNGQSFKIADTEHLLGPAVKDCTNYMRWDMSLKKVPHRV